jgi:C4-dicarboxylate transporter DctM subunit
MTTQGIPQKITEFLLTSINSEVVFLLVANLILIICGMFVDATTSILLVVPLLFPAALQFGVDPVHFGIITGINLSVGIMSPPFGICLFVANGLDRSLKLQGIYKEVIPFFIFAIVGILIITFVEPLSFILLGD